MTDADEILRDLRSRGLLVSIETRPGIPVHCWAKDVNAGPYERGYHGQGDTLLEALTTAREAYRAATVR